MVRSSIAENSESAMFAQTRTARQPRFYPQHCCHVSPRLFLKVLHEVVEVFKVHLGDVNV